MRPRCSVILPTYNRLLTLPRAVASVLAQEEQDFELLVVDDASTDQTAAWLATVDDPRLRVLRAPSNLGPSGARNLGLDAARAPAVAFLDSDDVYRADRLAVALAALEREPDVVCTLSSAVKQVWSEQRVSLVPAVKLAPAAFEWALICDLIPVETTGMTVRTEQARAIGGFAAGLRRTEDREFLIRLARLGAGRMLAEVLWEKSWSADGLSNEWVGAGRDLVAYARARPEFTGRYAAVGSYLATKILVADLRRRDLPTFLADLKHFRAAGLIRGSLPDLVRKHRDVRRYRRRMSSREGLESLAGGPETWQ
jgi:GT2 family glycosyltransferase